MPLSFLPLSLYFLPFSPSPYISTESQESSLWWCRRELPVRGISHLVSIMKLRMIEGAKGFRRITAFALVCFVFSLLGSFFFRSCCHRIGEIFICLVCLSYHCENDGSKLWGRNEVVWDKVTCLFFIDIWCFVVVAWSTFFSWSQFTFLFWYYVMLRWTSVWPCGDQLFKLIICAWFCCQKNKNKRKTWFCRPLSR